MKTSGLYRVGRGGQCYRHGNSKLFILLLLL
jgi:hypothetical protein